MGFKGTQEIANMLKMTIIKRERRGGFFIYLKKNK